MGVKKAFGMFKKLLVKRSRYFMLSAVFALAISGAVTLSVHRPEWKTGFSYQYLSPAGNPVSGMENMETPNPWAFYSERSNPVITQVEVLRSSKFLYDIQAGLKNEGITDWSPERIARSIHISNPSRSDLIQVEVKTAEKETSQKIATLLKQSYSRYLQDLQKEIVSKERRFVEKNLEQEREKLLAGEKHLRTILASAPQLQSEPFTNNPDWGEKTLTQSYVELTQRIKEVEANIALEDAKYKHYGALLSKDEKSLIEGVILGADPTLEKLTEQLATAQTDANILSVKYTPPYSEEADSEAKIKTLQKQFEAHRRKVLAGEVYSNKPIIRDPVRKNLVEELISAKIKLQSFAKVLEVLNRQKEDLFKSFEQISHVTGDYSAWSLQKSILHDTIVLLEKRLRSLNYQSQLLALPVRPFQELPEEPVPTQDTQDALVVFLSAFTSLFCLLGALPFLMDYQSSIIPSQSILSIVKDLLKAKNRQVIMMIPVYSGGHLNASVHLGGLLNQFGKDALVIDADLRHRLLSRKVIPLAHPPGVFEHLITPDMKKAYIDPLSSAKILPLEASLEADRIVEFSQVLQRLPRLWERWSSPVVILDISQWHEAYHQLLPYISQVVFYLPPSSHSNVLLPKVFKSKYHVPVSLVEIQPEL